MVSNSWIILCRRLTITRFSQCPTAVNFYAIIKSTSVCKLTCTHLGTMFTILGCSPIILKYTNVENWFHASQGLFDFSGSMTAVVPGWSSCALVWLVSLGLARPWKTVFGFLLIVALLSTAIASPHVFVLFSFISFCFVLGIHPGTWIALFMLGRRSTTELYAQLLVTC